jgi:hypothetical protein
MTKEQTLYIRTNFYGVKYQAILNCTHRRVIEDEQVELYQSGKLERYHCKWCHAMRNIKQVLKISVEEVEK